MWVFSLRGGRKKAKQNVAAVVHKSGQEQGLAAGATHGEAPHQGRAVQNVCRDIEECSNGNACKSCLFMLLIGFERYFGIHDETNDR